MKLGGKYIVQVSAEFKFWGHSPVGVHPKNVAFGYDVGKISAVCLVTICCCNCQLLFGLLTTRL